MRAQDQDQFKVFYELCSMIIQILKSPPLLLPIPNSYIASSSRRQQQQQQHPTAVSFTLTHASPTAFASLFIGISLALMLFGLVTFVIGFILMPWIIGLVFLFCVAELVSNLSDFGKSFLCPAPPQRVPEWSFSGTEA